MKKSVIIPFVVAAVFAGGEPDAADSAPLSPPGAKALIGRLSVAAAFGDGMVLQRGMPVPVWGTAPPAQSHRRVRGTSQGNHRRR